MGMRGELALRKRIISQNRLDGKERADAGADYFSEYSVKKSEEIDGSWSFESIFGEVNYDGLGTVKANLGDISGISLGNIAALSSYRIEDGSNAISHDIQFRNGGSCRLTYRKTGEIIEFTVIRVQVRMTKEKVLIVYPLDH